MGSQWLACIDVPDSMMEANPVGGLASVVSICADPLKAFNPYNPK